MECSERQTTGPSGKASRSLGAIVEGMRVRHWTKNAFVAAPLLFSGRFADPYAWVECLVAIVAFCALSSGVYLINDVCDRRRDGAHPVKSTRPVASGRLSVVTAVSVAVAHLAVGLVLAAAVVWFTHGPDLPLAGLGPLVWALAYLVTNLLYSFWLKAHMIVDVIAVAMGFVFRAMAGAAAIAVPISPWLVVCTFTLCLYLALSKRRGEIVQLPPERAGATRETAGAYRLEDIRHMLSVSAALAILTYALYCLAPRTVHRIGSAHMIWTLPLVVYGIFRYHRISLDLPKGDLVSVLLYDKIIWLTVAAYVVLVAVIIHFGGHPAVRSVLDAEILK